MTAQLSPTASAALSQIFGDAHSRSQLHLQTEQTTAQDYPSLYSPHLIRRPSLRSSRSSLGLRRLLRRRWTSTSGLDEQKVAELKHLSRCVNGNAAAEALNVSLHELSRHQQHQQKQYFQQQYQNQQHQHQHQHQRRFSSPDHVRPMYSPAPFISPLRFDPMSPMPPFPMRRMSEHLYQVDELPAEDSARESCDSSSSEASLASGAASDDSITSSSSTSTLSNQPQSPTLSVFKRHSNLRPAASHSFAYAQRRRPSLSTPRSLSFANGPPPPVLPPSPTSPTSPRVPAFALGPFAAPGNPGNVPRYHIHARSSSLPHVGGVAGQLRTPQKMKRSASHGQLQMQSDVHALTTNEAEGISVQDFQLQSHTQSSPSPPPLPKQQQQQHTQMQPLAASIEVAPKGYMDFPDPTPSAAGAIAGADASRRSSAISSNLTSPGSSVHGINEFASAASSGGVTVTTMTVTTTRKAKKAKGFGAVGKLRSTATAVSAAMMLVSGGASAREVAREEEKTQMLATAF